MLRFINAARHAAPTALRALPSACIPSATVSLVAFSTANAKDNTKNTPKSTFPSKFVAEYSNFPLSGKLSPLGEDAWYISKHSIGVADGVGGWMSEGVDSGVYSRSIMEHMKSFCVDAALEADLDKGVEIDLQAAVVHAHANTNYRGSTTVVAAAIGQKGELGILNLGDSAGMVWRYMKPALDGALQQLKVADAAKLWSLQMRTQPQYYPPRSQNVPVQLDKSRNDYVLAKHYNFNAQPGDIVVLASDGVYDNLTDSEIQMELAHHDMQAVGTYVGLAKQHFKQLHQNKNMIEDIKINSAAAPTTDGELAEGEKQARLVLKSMAARIAVAAQKAFNRGVSKHFPYGGKPDDVTVVVGLIVPDELA